MLAVLHLIWIHSRFSVWKLWCRCSLSSRSDTLRQLRDDGPGGEIGRPSEDKEGGKVGSDWGSETGESEVGMKLRSMRG